MLGTKIYDLFSRGSSDWLRHNNKVRDSIKKNLPDLLAGQDVISSPNSKRTVLVPVTILEHARLRLNSPEEGEGAGQGEGKAGDVLRPGQGNGQAQGEGEGDGAGEGGGGFKFHVELNLDEVMDWLWQELKLPDLKPKRSAMIQDPDYIKEGWDKRGAPSRLDRRKTMKEAIKRRGIQQDPVPFTNEDLRYRQLTRKDKPSTNAVVFCALDVSGSMGEGQRKLAKTFFYFALQGIRRQYSKVEVVFIAHAGQAKEFSEQDFFKINDGGGTVSSTAFNLGLEIIEKRYDPSAFNIYFFYASDGDNSPSDLRKSVESLTKLSEYANYCGYVETSAGGDMGVSQLNNLFSGFQASGKPVGMSPLNTNEDIWNAIRLFFKEETK
jgi:uncharacterized protein